MVYNEIQYADDLVLMNESMQDLQRKFTLWKATLESKEIKVNINGKRNRRGNIKKQNRFMWCEWQQ